MCEYCVSYVNLYYLPLVLFGIYCFGFAGSGEPGDEVVHFTNPNDVFSAAVAAESASRAAKARALHSKTVHNHKKRAALVERCLPFATYHTTPRLFTPDVVDDLNASRPRDNQLEWLPTGLLRHHCCYPECPDFLGPAFRHASKPESRLALMRHLAPNWTLLNYVPTFHVMAQALARRSGASLAEFARAMDAHFAGKPAYDALPNKDAQVEAAWHHWRHALHKE